MCSGKSQLPCSQWLILHGLTSCHLGLKTWDLCEQALKVNCLQLFKSKCIRALDRLGQKKFYWINKKIGQLVLWFRLTLLLIVIYIYIYRRRNADHVINVIGMPVRPTLGIIPSGHSTLYIYIYIYIYIYASKQIQFAKCGLTYTFHVELQHIVYGI